MALGEEDVEAMLRRHNAKWLRGWEHYDQLEPFGAIRGDYQAASIVQMLYNLNCGNQRPRTLQDCMLVFKEAEPKRKQTWQQMKSMAMMIAMAYNAEGKTE